jgi:hypothetical protein
VSAGTIDLDYLQALSRELDRPVKTLIALGVDNDPFYADMRSRRAAAEWFADLWQRIGFRHGVHLRRINNVQAFIDRLCDMVGIPSAGK